jgi:hypothetical protein
VVKYSTSNLPNGYTNATLRQHAHTEAKAQDMRPACTDLNHCKPATTQHCKQDTTHTNASNIEQNLIEYISAAWVLINGTRPRARAHLRQLLLLRLRQHLLLGLRPARSQPESASPTLWHLHASATQATAQRARTSGLHHTPSTKQCQSTRAEQNTKHAKVIRSELHSGNAACILKGGWA